MQTMHDQFSFKIDVYPKDMTEAYDLLKAHTTTTSTKKGNQKGNGHNQNQDVDTEAKPSLTGLSYLQEETVKGNDCRLILHITCYACGKKGHYC